MDSEDRDRDRTEDREQRGRVKSRKGGGEDERRESWREPEAERKPGGHVSLWASELQQVEGRWLPFTQTEENSFHPCPQCELKVY